MRDLETRLRNHLANQAERIDVADGSPPVPRSRSPWANVVIVPIAATVALIALVGALVLLDRDGTRSDGSETLAATVPETIPEPPATTNPSGAPGFEAAPTSTAGAPTTQPADASESEAVPTQTTVPEASPPESVVADSITSDTSPLQVGAVEEIPGRGLVFGPDNQVMLSAIPDPQQPGCEGFAAETWHVVDLVDGSTTPVGDGDVTGTAIPIGERVAIANICEGFLDSIRVGRFADDGSFTLDDTNVPADEELQQATLTADRASGELVAVTAESIRRLNLATGEWARSVASPFSVQPSSVSVIGEIFVGAVYREQPDANTDDGDGLAVEVYRENTELLYSLVDCSTVVSDLADDEAVASGECGIYKVRGNGELRLFWEEPVLSARPIPNSDNVLAFTLADDGAAGEWEIITPSGERHLVPGSDQAPDIIVSDDGDVLAVQSGDAESTRIVTTKGVTA